jgi:hypothetical protein
MMDGIRQTGWLARNASTIALFITAFTLVFSAGVAWAVVKEHEYVDSRDQAIQEELSKKLDFVILEIGKLQGWKDAQRKQ